MVRTIVQLTEEQSARLRERAKDEGVSVAELVRRGVDHILSTQSRDEEIRKRALSAIGFISDGEAPDLAVDHDRYLAEVYDQ